MKEGWEYKSLGEVCKIYNGNSINADYKKEHFLGATGGLPFIATKDVSPLGTIDYNNGVRIPNYEEFKVAPANSVFICAEGGSAGKKFAYVEKDVCFGNKLFCITPKDKAIKGKFIYHFVQSDNFRGQFFSLLTGLIGGVSAKKFQTIEIPVPSLSEQQSIVDYLDSAFAKIDTMKANAEKALNEAKALFQASLKEMLEPKEGWEEKTLKEVAKYRRGSFPQPYGNKEWYDGAGAMPFVQVAELQEDSFDMIPVTKRRISKIAQPLSVFVPAGTVLVSLQGSIGKVAITNYDSYVDRTIAIFQDYKISIDKTFFAYQLKIRFEIERIKARGTTIKTITKEEFANFIINCPSLSEQQTIVDTLDSLKSKVDKLQENYDKISQECDALKQAILRQVFE